MKKHSPPTKWEDCGRDDLKAIPLMIANGFTPIFSHKDQKTGRISIDNIPSDTVRFTKRDIHVWKVYSYKEDGMYTSWIAAKLVGDEYVEQKPLKNLKSLFK